MPISCDVHGKHVEIPDDLRQPVEVWDRVMGYFRPVTNWNIGKQQEHRDRVRFSSPVEDEEVTYEGDY